MGAASVSLFCLQGFRPGPHAVQEDTQTIDLGRKRLFLAWAQIGMIGGRGKGPWDFDNQITAEVLAVDESFTGIEAFGGRLGPQGAFTNYHGGAIRSFGRQIIFRLRVWQPEEMFALATGIVLFDV
jgi:hypothetical protein